MAKPAKEGQNKFFEPSGLHDPAWFTQAAPAAPQQNLWALGILGSLLILATLAFGAVHPWAYSLLELLLLGVGFFFIARQFMQLIHSTENYKVEWIRFPLTPWLICLGVWITLQLIPLPAGLVAWLSPQAVAIRELGTVSAPAWYPLSLNPFATKLELFQLLLAIGMIYLTLWVVKSSKGIVAVILIIAGLGLFEVILGAGQLFANPVRIWGYKTATFSSEGARLSGTFINPDNMAALLEMAFFCTFGLFLGLKSSGLKSKNNKELNGQPLGWQGLKKMLLDPQSTDAGTKRMIVFFLSVVLALGLVLTQSRGGVLAFLVALVTIFFMKHSQEKGRFPWAPLGFFIGSLALYIWLVSGGVDMSRFGTIFEEKQLDRFSLYQGTVAMFRDFPLLGAGWGTFTDVFPKYQTDLFQGQVVDFAHSDWLQLLGEIGIVGFLLVLFGAVSYFLHIWKFLKKRQDSFAVGITLGCLGGLLSVGLHAAVDFPFHIPANAMVTGVVLALAFLAVHCHRHPREHFSYPVQQLRCRRPLGFVFLGSLAVVFVLLALPVWNHWAAESLVPSQVDFTRSRSAYTAYRLPEIKKAMAYTPDNPAYPVLLAVKLNASRAENGPGGDAAPLGIEKVIDLYKQAIQENPSQWQYRLEYAWALIGTVNPQNLSPFRQGLQELETCTKLFPASGLVNFNYGMALLMAEKSFPRLLPPEKTGLGDKEIELGINKEPSLAASAEKLFQKIDNNP